MGYYDHNFGWHQERFILSDFTLTTGLSLMAQSEDGDWEERCPTFNGWTKEEKAAGEAAYDRRVNLVYRRDRRVLSATARLDEDSYNKLYLGVPIGETEPESEAGLESIQVTISEIQSTDYDLGSSESHYLGGGRIKYHAPIREPGIQFAGGVSARFYVPSDAFDAIEREILTNGSEIKAEINIRGLHWVGPIGDTKVFLDKEKWTPAELAELKITRGRRSAPDAEKNLDAEDGGSGAPPVIRCLEELQASLVAIKSGVWIAALGILWLAYSK